MPFAQVEFTIGAHAYRMERLHPFKQYHLARRLATLSPAMVEALADPEFAQAIAARMLNLRDGTPIPEQEMSPASFVRFLLPFAREIGGMSDADSEYILLTALSAVKRQDGGGWAPLIGPNGALMYADLQLPEMMNIVWKVIESHLSGFFSDAAPS